MSKRLLIAATAALAFAASPALARAASDGAVSTVVSTPVAALARSWRCECQRVTACAPFASASTNRAQGRQKSNSHLSQ